MVQLIFYQFFIRMKKETERDRKKQKIKQKKTASHKISFLCFPSPKSLHILSEKFSYQQTTKRIAVLILILSQRLSLSFVFRVSSTQAVSLSLTRSAFHQNAKWQIRNTLCTITYHTRGMRRYFDEYKQVLIGLPEWHNTRFASTQNEKGEFSFNAVHCPAM